VNRPQHLGLEREPRASGQNFQTKRNEHTLTRLNKPKVSVAPRLPTSSGKTKEMIVFVVHPDADEVGPEFGILEAGTSFARIRWPAATL
jgi:hypothetical protein